MERHERFRQIRSLFWRQKVVTTAALLEETGAALATIKRDLDFLRDRLGWPISMWNATKGGYVLEGAEHSLELPELWFSAAEIHALVAMQQLLSGLEPGLLGDRMRPLAARLQRVLEQDGLNANELERRVKVIQLGRRKAPIEHFETVAGALLARKRLIIEYWHRDRQELTPREISPLQLVHYRENWVLDAWCHMRKGLRTFALDAIRTVKTTDKVAKEVSAAILAEHFEPGYGIYSGPARSTARLKFTPARAQYVSLETWHKKEVAQSLPDGSYLLEVPYSSDVELVMDLMRYGPDVEVLGPPELRQKLAALHEAAAKQYAG